MFNNKIINIIKNNKAITDIRFLEKEIDKFLNSNKRKDMITGEAYYIGKHDILSRKKTVIGADGSLVEVKNLPNNKIVDNQYCKLVDQKVNYLISKIPTLETQKAIYADNLQNIFNSRFWRMLKNTAEDSINSGISWVHPHYDEESQLCFTNFPAYEILPFWRDRAHTLLDMVVRIYDVDTYQGEREVKITKVEVYSEKGVEVYSLEKGKLLLETPLQTHIQITNTEGEQVGYNFSKIPFIAFKYNNKEVPLINRVKSLQDGINTVLSDFQNNMQQDARNTILVLQNYDGTNLGEFRQNLAQYGVIKVKTVDGVAGDLKTLEVKVDSGNYKELINLFKRAMIENGRGFDAKDDRLAGTPNQMNIQSMYADIDLDANGLENEYQASFEDLLWFINIHFSNIGVGNFQNETVRIIFNRDMLINESESIENCIKSVGVISNETIISQHPWTLDTKNEVQKLLSEQNNTDYEYVKGSPNE